MPLPVDQRRYLQCDACKYSYRKGALQRRGPTSFVCQDKDRCRANRATRERMDAHKR